MPFLLNFPVSCLSYHRLLVLIVSTPNKREGDPESGVGGGRGDWERWVTPATYKFLLHVCDHLGDSKILNKWGFFRVFSFLSHFPVYAWEAWSSKEATSFPGLSFWNWERREKTLFPPTPPNFKGKSPQDSIIGSYTSWIVFLYFSRSPLMSRIEREYCLISAFIFGRLIWRFHITSDLTGDIYQWGHFPMLNLRNLNLISVHSWAYLDKSHEQPTL